jgi:putative transposase
MPTGLRRFHQSGESHFVTFSCYGRRLKFVNAAVYDLFPLCLEHMRCKFQMRIYGYVVMPEHVHLLLSEPERGTLADAMHYLKLSFSKRVRSLRICTPGSTGVSAPGSAGVCALGSTGVCAPGSPLLWANLGPHPFWQKRYHDRNVRDAHEFTVKLRYLHRNPVKRGLVKDPGDWKWSSFRHYALRENGVVEIESEWTARDRELKEFGGPARIFLNPG